jgi:hypothetical protein
MNDAESALLGQRDGHVRFGDGVHGGADDGNIQADVAGELQVWVRVKEELAVAGITSERAGNLTGRTSSKVRASGTGK